MPLFTFECGGCGMEFDVFTQIGVPEHPVCVSCGSIETERRYKPCKVVVDGIHPNFGSQMHDRPFHDMVTGNDFSSKAEQRRFYKKEGIHFLEKGEE